MIKSFQDLEVYQLSKNLFEKVVAVTKQFPKEGQYLSLQLNRSANSIHANIAEGFGRSEAEFKQYLTRSLGSNNETISHLEDADIAGYIEKDVFETLREEYTILGKRIYRLRENWKPRKK